jgi:uncharacterized membrane protein YgcG
MTTSIQTALDQANAAIASIGASLVTLQNQSDLLNVTPVTVNQQISILTAANTDVFYLYSDHGVVNVGAANGGIIFPTGTTQQRPTSPQSGTVRYNTNSSSLEIYTSTWQDVGTGASSGGSSGVSGSSGGGGANGGIFYVSSQQITSSFVSGNANNILSVGPLTLSNTSVAVQITGNSVWKVI